MLVSVLLCMHTAFRSQEYWLESGHAESLYYYQNSSLLSLNLKSMQTFMSFFERILMCQKILVSIYRASLFTHYTIIDIFAEFICYDDACHLRKYARNPTRKESTPVPQCLAAIEIVVDKMHMSGHTDRWCQMNCDPKLFSQLDKVCDLVVT